MRNADDNNPQPSELERHVWAVITSRRMLAKNCTYHGAAFLARTIGHAHSGTVVVTDEAAERMNAETEKA